MEPSSSPPQPPPPPWPLVTCHVTLPQAELESGSEVSSLAGLGAVSKEQLVHSYQRMRAKYNKYRGRYTDLARAFHSLENDNEKMRVSALGGSAAGRAETPGKGWGK